MTIFTEVTTANLLIIAERQAANLERFLGMTPEERLKPVRSEKGEKIIGSMGFQIHIFINALRELKSRGIPIIDWEWVLEEADNAGV